MNNKGDFSVNRNLVVGGTGAFTSDLHTATRIYNDTITTFANGATTPSISGNNVFKTGNAGLTTITNFTNGVTSQGIKIIFGDANTTIQNNANIILNGGIDALGVVNATMTFTNDGGVWKEVTRIGMGGGNLRHKYYPMSFGGTNVGSYATNTVAANANGYASFQIPNDWKSTVNIKMIGIISAGAAGAAKNIDFFTMYATIGTAYNTFSQSDIVSTYALVANQVTAFNLNALFTNIAADMVCGVNVKHNAIGGVIDYLGIELEYRD